MAEPCPFCEIGVGDVDQDLVVLRTGDVFVIPTLKQRPANHGQVIVLPVAHVTALHEAGPVLRADVFDVVATSRRRRGPCGPSWRRGCGRHWPTNTQTQALS